MAKIQVWAWKCEVCGHEWKLATQDQEPPTWCAKCRSRKWNHSASIEHTFTLGMVLETTRERTPQFDRAKAEFDTALAGVKQDLEVGGKAKWYPNPRLAKLNEDKYGKKSKT